ncbi:unnamed protein product [Aspergillus oryzae]|uniref:Unnamed protein product n=1 Tax=Aspergillus oryzae TaxID=5062 RepID=A0AAN4YSU8_ASPOZ|nr:unnamed protein product [Aspergillus oryzae]
MLGSFSVMRPAMPSGCLSAGLDGEGSGTAAIGWKFPRETLRRVIDDLATKTLFSRAVGGIDHVPIAHRKFRLISARLPNMNIPKCGLAIAKGRRKTRALAALPAISPVQRNIIGELTYWSKQGW